MDDVREFSRKALVLGALLAGTGVALGAFGAHGLKARLDAEMLAIFETAVRYQMYHAFGIIATALAASYFGKVERLRVAAWSFGIGIALFCGSLFVLSMSGATWLGAITPIGGLAFLVGWGALIVAALEKRNID